ncbi:MAG: DUF1934 domain-containing protein [Bacillota bacterium]|nr:DUF1934 domain-containing protein [Bacillota bacterium]
MKEVLVKIKSRQVNNDTGEDEMEFVTEAKLYRRKDAYYLIYDESEFSGMPGCKTRLRLRGQELQMKRLGEGAGVGNEILFSKGQRFTGLYDTPFGPIELEVLTNDLDNNIDEEGKGYIDVDYDISLKGLAEGRNTLNITLM